MEFYSLKGNMCLIYFLKLESWGKTMQFPYGSKHTLTREGKTFEDLGRYRRLVRKLNYLKVTCPDIAHSVSIVS